MEKKKKNIIILICLSVVFILVCIFICVDLFSVSTFDKFLINDNEDIKENDEIINDNENSDNVNQEKNDNDINSNIENNKNENVNDEDVKEDNSNLSNNNKYNDDYNTENDVVKFFKNMENEIDSSSTFKEKFKKYFIDIVDFIFYDKEIKGYTFDELGSMAKIKIISIALKMDSKIEEYVPNYKENISDTSSKVYNNVKEKLITSYLEISTDICSGDNEAECRKVKEIFGEVKDVCKIGWSFIKTLVGNGVTKLRGWYEIYSGK